MYSFKCIYCIVYSVTWKVYIVRCIEYKRSKGQKNKGKTIFYNKTPKYIWSVVLHLRNVYVLVNGEVDLKIWNKKRFGWLSQGFHPPIIQLSIGEILFVNFLNSWVQWNFICRFNGPLETQTEWQFKHTLFGCTTNKNVIIFSISISEYKCCFKSTNYIYIHIINDPN